MMPRFTQSAPRPPAHDAAADSCGRRETARLAALARPHVTHKQPGGGHMRRTGFLASIVALIVAAAAMPASAQTTTGGITGVVRDSGGGVMPGVSVRATHEATNAAMDAMTNELGIYILRGLPVGRYTVVAELAGFQTARNTDVVGRVNEDVRLDVALKVGSIAETV